MTEAILRLLIRKNEHRGKARLREHLGKAAGTVGILSNLLLFALKLLAGLRSGSISILADAVNNLSDCGSSVITLAGFHLSAIPADEQHPYGHARFEYISGLAVSVLVLLIGVEFLKNSVAKIITPTTVEFSPLVFAVLLASVLLKLWQGGFNAAVGKYIDSGALAATAADSRGDALATGAVLLAGVVMRLTGWNLDGWMGALVAVLVILSGISLIRETVNPLLGTAPDPALVEAIQQKVLSYPSVLGAHDLMVHSYGPGRSFASVHAEVPAGQDILLSHDIIDNMEREISHSLGISLVVHMDPVVTDDPRTNAMRELVRQQVSEFDPILTVHDFRMVQGNTHSNLIFDVVAPPRYRLTDPQLRRELRRRIQVKGETVHCVITVDHSYTSSQ